MSEFTTFGIAWILGMIIVGAIFIITMILSSSRAEEEQGQFPLYEERCGGQFGFITYSRPFVRLSLYNEFIVISCWSQNVIPYQHIRHLERVGIIFSGIEIITNNTEVYGQPILWTFNRKKIWGIIEDRINAVV